MRQFVPILALVPALVLGAECMIDLSVAKLSPFNPKHPSVQSVEKNRREGNFLVSEVKMVGGLVIKFSQGGCMHWGHSFEFSNIGSAYPRENLFRLGILLHNQVPFPAKKLGGQQLLKFLNKHDKKNPKFDKKIFSDSCGDAVCEIELKNDRLVLSYQTL